MENINVLGLDCCGCRSCEQSCPKKCISMKENNEGFIYPVIDDSACINCGLCLKKCPIYNYHYEEKQSNVFALANKNNDELLKSASGGAAYFAMKSTLANNGVVYGVAYNENHVAKTIRVDNLDELYKLQSSKYVFADTNNCYQEVLEDLKNGLKVLFTGTSCQVDGLLKFLGKKYDNLFTISLICHGTPSPKLFKGYIEYLEKEFNSKIVKYNHRAKRKSFSGYCEYIKFENGQEIYRPFFDTPYGSDFIGCKANRESCYRCKYCNTSRVGDWSIGDYWGIENEHPDFPSLNGHSLVIVNSEAGLEMIEKSKEDCVVIDSKIEKAIPYQVHLSKPADRPAIRDTIYKQLDEDKDFFKHRTPKKNIKYYIKKLIPNKLKRFIKKILHK